ncbi:MAG: YciI family protein [Gemmataceae bacterium]
MKYFCLVYHEEQNLAALSSKELETLAGGCGAWKQELGGHHILSAALQSARVAATVRCRNGKTTISDGPFAETKEFLGGFTLIDAKDLNEAVQLASKLPAVRLVSASVEVRPVLEPDMKPTDPLDQKIVAAFQHVGHSS